MKVVVFDIGGTLMEYRGMPNVWLEFYEEAFAYVNSKLNLSLSEDDIRESLGILRNYNPRVNYREKEYTPEFIFADVTKHWQGTFTLENVISAFFASMKLTPYIYAETVSVLKSLKADGYKIATLTDVATGMPDKLHKSYFAELMPYFDLYVSSSSCGFRKPDPKGLKDIAEYFGVKASDMIFIGDEEKDIVTAKRFGCVGVFIDRYNRECDFNQDVTVKDLNELLCYIRQVSL